VASVSHWRLIPISLADSNRASNFWFAVLDDYKMVPGLYRAQPALPVRGALSPAAIACSVAAPTPYSGSKALSVNGLEI